MYRPFIASLALALPLTLAPTALAQPDRSARPSAAPTDLASRGNAYGSSAKGNTYIQSGPTAPIYMCTTEKSKRKRNFLAATGTDVPLRLSGVQNSTVRKFIDGRPATVTIASIADVRLGEADLAIKGLQARAQVIALPNGKFERSYSTSVARLSIAGELIQLEELNQPLTLPIPGVGVITLNTGGNFAVSGGGAGVRALAARIRLEDEDKTVIRLSKASAAFAPERRDVVSGSAHALNASALGGVALVGRVANQPLPCEGTSGVEKLNETAGLTIPGLLSLEGAYGKAFSNQGPKFTRARTAGGVARVVLGDGQVVIDGLSSVVRVKKDLRGKRTMSTRGSAILGFTVDGEPQALPIDGESVEIPGLGRLEFGVVEKRNNGLKRTAVLLVLLDETGAEIRVPIGVASAYIGG